MDGVYILFMTVVIIGLLIDYAAQFRPPDHQARSDAMDIEPDDVDLGDDAA